MKSIIIMTGHQQGYHWPSHATPPYCPSLPAGPQGTSCIYTELQVRTGRPTFDRPCEGVHKSTSLMNSSLLLHQCSSCLVCLILIVFVMGGWWPYSCCFVGCCLHELFNIVRSMFPLSYHSSFWLSLDLVQLRESGPSNTSDLTEQGEPRICFGSISQSVYNTLINRFIWSCLMCKEG